MHFPQPVLTFCGASLSKTQRPTFHGIIACFSVMTASLLFPIFLDFLCAVSIKTIPRLEITMMSGDRCKVSSMECSQIHQEELRQIRKLSNELVSTASTAYFCCSLLFFFLEEGRSLLETFGNIISLTLSHVRDLIMVTFCKTVTLKFETRGVGNVAQ